MRKDASADGLRGVAAVNVVLCHLLFTIFPVGFQYLWPHAAEATIQLGAMERILSAPFLSVFWNGNFPVCIFFVLSGYVLTAVFSANGDLDQLTTQALRRYFRLGVPVLGSVLLAYVAMHFGIASRQHVVSLTGNHWLATFWKFDPTIGMAVKDGAYQAMLTGASAFVPVLWTMRIELLGSFLVFGYAALAPRGPLALLFFAVVTVAISSIAPETWPFYAGFLVGVHIGRVRTSNRKALAMAVVGAIVFGSFDASPLFDWSVGISSDFYWRKNFFNMLGGACAVYAVRCGFGARVLTCPPVQFVGRISYALYLVHFSLVLSLEPILYASLSGWGLSRAPAAAMSIAATLFATFIVAVMFRRTFDAWGIALSHRLFPGTSRVESIPKVAR
ncbi:peptidoglycan/LPS O-acetylase OafA/YrhL [Luteibacter sp. 621]|uniref:acyltransferase family protein n=1 Tax=Luteibacter sp. 621 TaxID=3373916 RepID=UPI003D245266